MSTALLVEYTIDFGLFATFAGLLLCLIRLLRGPTLADRALAADTIITHLMALVLLFTIRAGSLQMFDGVLVLALLGFATTIAVSQYLLRQRGSSLGDMSHDEPVQGPTEEQP